MVTVTLLIFVQLLDMQRQHASRLVRGIHLVTFLDLGPQGFVRQGEPSRDAADGPQT